MRSPVKNMTTQPYYMKTGIKHMLGASVSVLSIAVLGMLYVSPSVAADLGGNCCADLEERVAELESSVVTKGNSKVSLKLSGQVNKALLFWNDGHESDAFVVDNNLSSTRIYLSGDAKISSTIKAGFNMEFDLEQDNSNAVTNRVVSGLPQGAAGAVSDDDSAFLLNLSVADIWVKGTLGKITLGQGGTASDGTSGVTLSGTDIAGGVALGDVGGNFEFIRNDGTGTGIRLGDAFNDLGGNGGAKSRIRYDTPEFAGFIVSTSWGEDDMWDVALRFKAEWKDIKLAAAIAYSESDDESAVTRERINGSASILHVPTGLNLTFAAGDEDFGDGLDRSMYYVKLGLRQKWTSLGETAISADYAVGEEITFNNAELKHYGVQFVQNIDAAAMEVYASWSHNELDLTGGAQVDDLDLFMVGSRIRF